MPQTTPKTAAVPAFLSGVVTAAVLYVANKLHVPVLDTDVEAAVTPLVSAGVTALVHLALVRKTTQAVETEVAKVEADPLVALVTQQVVARLTNNPSLKAALVQVALNELTKPLPVPAPKVAPAAPGEPNPLTQDVPAPVGTSPQSTSVTLPPSAA
jgi:hypothetical protein